MHQSMVKNKKKAADIPNVVNKDTLHKVQKFYTAKHAGV